MICIECHKGIPDSERVITGYTHTRTRYRKSCKKCIRAKSRVKEREKRTKVGSNRWLTNRITKLKARALKKGRRVTITDQELRELYLKERCFYCNEICEIRTIDRVDNNDGYTYENCVMSCFTCNRLKGRLTKEDLPRLKKILWIIS